jgi:predicted RNase H-like nuclease (RuvC/YqgF family)
MGRKGNITTTVIGVRTPIKLFTKLLNEASDKGMAISPYIVQILSDLDANGGLTPQEPTIIYKDKIVEKIVEKNVPVKVEVNNKELEDENYELWSKNRELKKRIQEIENKCDDLQKKMPKPKPTKEEIDQDRMLEFYAGEFFNGRLNEKEIEKYNVLKALKQKRKEEGK